MAGLFGLRFILSCDSSSFRVDPVSSSSSQGVGCRIGSDWVLGVRHMASCGEDMEAGQSSVRSGGSLVLSLGHGGFRLKDKSPGVDVCYHQHQIVPS